MLWGDILRNKFMMQKIIENTEPVTLVVVTFSNGTQKVSAFALDSDKELESYVKMMFNHSCDVKIYYSQQIACELSW